MKVIYEGVDITNDIDIQQADCTDNAGGIADSINFAVSDASSIWSKKWKPIKGQRIELKKDGYSSGTMHVDDIKQVKGSIIIRATSLPLNSKSNNVKTWENARLLNIATDIVASRGIALQSVNIQNHLYDRIDQKNETDLQFLNRICRREYYALKITNDKAVIYDISKQEQETPVLTINSWELIGPYEFESSSDLKSSCTVRFISSQGELIAANYKANTALDYGVLKINERVSSQGEALRFARGYLMNHNKFEHKGIINIRLNTTVAAGNTIRIAGLGLADGKYFVEKAIHRFKKDILTLQIRRPLEGY